MSGFAQAVAIIFELEGGLADLKGDRGGRTKFGISTPKWLLWRDRLGKPGAPVDACTIEDAQRIYHADEWVGGKCDALAWPLSLAHFDSMVQHGQAPQLLQRTLGVRVDGVLGPATLAAAAAGDPQRRAEDLLWARLAYYASLPQDQFNDGWMNRLCNLRKYVVGQRPLPRVA